MTVKQKTPSTMTCFSACLLLTKVNNRMRRMNIDSTSRALFAQSKCISRPK
ncbi:MAG: hypothetical protein PHG65_03070 [Kiritimatiellae bacterium]|nr:hypothetical protein [Kiritimatiellia bacterium]